MDHREDSTFSFDPASLNVKKLSKTKKKKIDSRKGVLLASYTRKKTRRRKRGRGGGNSSGKSDGNGDKDSNGKGNRSVTPSPSPSPRHSNASPKPQQMPLALPPPKHVQMAEFRGADTLLHPGNALGK